MLSFMAASIFLLELSALLMWLILSIFFKVIICSGLKQVPLSYLQTKVARLGEKAQIELLLAAIDSLEFRVTFILGILT